MSLEKQVMDGMKAAMKAKDQARLRALRAIKSAILLAKTEKGGGDDLTEEQEIKIVTKLAKQRKDSLETFKAQNREDLAKEEQEELDVLQDFLPEQMSEADLKDGLNILAQQLGVKGPQDMGKIMGAAMKQFGGKADGKVISSIVRELLNS